MRNRAKNFVKNCQYTNEEIIAVEIKGGIPEGVENIKFRYKSSKEFQNVLWIGFQAYFLMESLNSESSRSHMFSLEFTGICISTDKQT